MRLYVPFGTRTEQRKVVSFNEWKVLENRISSKNFAKKCKSGSAHFFAKLIYMFYTSNIYLSGSDIEKATKLLTLTKYWKILLRGCKYERGIDGTVGHSEMHYHRVWIRWIGLQMGRMAPGDQLQLLRLIEGPLQPQQKEYSA